jgi:hypothetical protein
MVATFLTGSFLTLLLPVRFPIAIGLYWWLVARRRDEF